MLEYQSSSHTVLAGFSLQPTPSLEIVVDGSWTTADAAMAPFDFQVPEEFLAVNPNMSFDFARTYLNSDLDISRVELGVRARYSVNSRLFVRGSYRYLDYDDDAPYLYDTTGSVDVYGFGLGWEF